MALKVVLRAVLALACLWLLGAVSSARAQDSALQQDAGRFSLGAGLGYSFESDALGTGAAAGLGVLAGTNAPRRVPFGTSLFEVLLTQRLRLVLGVTGAYGKPVHADGNGQVSPVGAGKTWHFGGALGVRWVLNPGGVVEVSPLLSFGAAVGEINRYPGSYSQDSEGNLEVRTYTDARGQTYDARLGLVLERALLENLYLRFEAHFARVAYINAEIHRYGEQNERSERGDVSVSYGFTPVLQLRLTF